MQPIQGQERSRLVLPRRARRLHRPSLRRELQLEVTALSGSSMLSWTVLICEPQASNTPSRRRLVGDPAIPLAPQAQHRPVLHPVTRPREGQGRDGPDRDGI
jgi:hypothetical protein